MKNKEEVAFFPEQFLLLSDLETVFHTIASYCRSSAGKEDCINIQVYSDINSISQIQTPVKESLNILLSGKAFPDTEFSDNRESLSLLKTPGWVAELTDIFELGKVLKTMQKLVLFAQEHPNSSVLQQIIFETVFHQHLIQTLFSVIDDTGIIRDDASDELFRLKKEYLRFSRDIEKRLNSIFKELKLSGLVVEDSKMTIRNGRNVIPVPANFKYKIKGIIHDESATGQTAYVEPMEIVEMGNKMRENLSAQQREVRRILAEISDILRFHIDDILNYYEILKKIDVCFAKARFGAAINGIIPNPEPFPLIDWKNARNIVLHSHLQKQGKTLVPLEISMGQQNRLIVLSGANAGGKSLVIKTVALIQAMIQCGLPVPVDENSKTGVFSLLFLDIGDGQSIESDLSTYSSHLETMKVFLNKVDDKSLYLIDEIGSGTDPVLGGSLAQAILMKLHSEGAFGIVTTHLDVLKKMADEMPEASNAAMIFNTEKLQPTYTLRPGIPGNSFTFEIAARTGIPGKIIEQAQHFAGDERITFEQKISDVEQKAIELQEIITKHKIAEEFLDETIKKYSALIEKIENQQREIIEKSKQEALDLLNNANSTIENTIRVIKESAADKEITKTARKEIEATKQEIQQHTPSKKISEKLKNPIPVSKTEKSDKIISVELKQGTPIIHKHNQSEGVILEVLSSNKLKVAFNNVSVIMNTSDVIPVKEKTSAASKVNIRLEGELNKKTGNFARQIDMRGFKAEEVMAVLEKHIDDGLLIGVYDFSILHGKGNGVLRNVVRQLLSKHPNVESFESEHIERGGDGITLVKLIK